MTTGKLVVLCVVGILAVAGMAMAVGFESINLNGDQTYKAVSASVKSPNNVKPQTDFSFFDQCPYILEETVEMVKDLLGQFGIIDRKAP